MAQHSKVVFIMLINVKMPTIVGISTFMSRISFDMSNACLFCYFYHAVNFRDSSDLKKEQNIEES